MPKPTLLPPARHWAAALVLGLHVLGSWLALRQAPWGDRDALMPLRPPLVVSLLRPPPPRAHLAPPSAARRPSAAIAAPPPPATLPTPEPQAITLLPPAPAQAVPGPAALNLVLPRAASAPWRARHPGLDDARANTPRATMESRINAAMRGDDRLIEERIDENTVRFRKGSGCVIVQGSRTALIDPGNQSFSRTPGLAKPC